MSLSKSYQIGCESTDLQMRRLLAALGADEDWAILLAETRPERTALRGECALYSQRESSAKIARTQAKAAGWKRHTERLPLYRGASDDDYSSITFDLCPACAPKMAAKPTGSDDSGYHAGSLIRG